MGFNCLDHSVKKEKHSLVMSKLDFWYTSTFCSIFHFCYTDTFWVDNEHRNLQPSLIVCVVASHRTGDKPLSGPMVAWFTDAYMRHSTSMWCRYNQVVHAFNIIKMPSLKSWRISMSRWNATWNHFARSDEGTEHFYYNYPRACHIVFIIYGNWPNRCPNLRATFYVFIYSL